MTFIHNLASWFQSTKLYIISACVIKILCKDHCYKWIPLTWKYHIVIDTSMFFAVFLINNSIWNIFANISFFLLFMITLQFLEVKLQGKRYRFVLELLIHIAKLFNRKVVPLYNPTEVYKGKQENVLSFL